MGVGFGNLGEYQESAIYFEKALKEKPNGSEKKQKSAIPDWVRNTANWWSLTQITDQDFSKSLEYQIQNEIIQIPESGFTESESTESESESELPSGLRKNAGWWSQGLLSDEGFFESIQWLINNGFINGNIQQITQKSRE